MSAVTAEGMVVPGQAVVPAAAGRLKGAVLAGLEAEAVVAHRDRFHLPGHGAGDYARGACEHAMHEAAGSPLQRIGWLLNVGEIETCVPDFALVGTAVAVGIAEEEDVRRVADDETIPERQDARGEAEAFGESGDGFELAIAVAIFEPFDAAPLFVAGRPATVGITGHFADIHPTAIIERHRDGIDDRRFMGDDANLDTRGRMDMPDRLGRFIGPVAVGQGLTDREAEDEGEQSPPCQNGIADPAGVQSERVRSDAPRDGLDGRITSLAAAIRPGAEAA
jgi:hypothetical protein